MTFLRFLNTVLNLNIVPFAVLITIASNQKTKDEDGFLYPVKPEKCFGTEEIENRHCCIFPPFFTRDVMKACGVLFEFLEDNQRANISTIRRNMPFNCDHWKCILNKYGFLDEKKFTIDLDLVFEHFERWVELNPDFKTVMLKAKIHCKRNMRFYIPLSPCEYFQLQTCIRQFVKMDCPNMINDPLCNKQKAFYQECRQYFL